MDPLLVKPAVVDSGCSICDMKSVLVAAPVTLSLAWAVPPVR